jgi:phosphoribosylanthranilate isomerase
VFVKVCGVTSVADALGVVEAGVDAVGLNLVPSSRRRISREMAREISEAVRGRVLRIGVVADLPPGELWTLREYCQLDRWQLVGHEPEAMVENLLPHAFKAVRIGTPLDLDQAASYPGEWLLVDAKVEGQLGGTGQTLDWDLVAPLARKRKLILAGGLTPENVAEAVGRVSPWGVDVASGVELLGDPRRKDQDRVRRFVQAARSRSSEKS